MLAYVYDSGLADVPEVAAEALTAFAEVNALDPTVFPSVAVLENDLVGWGLDLVHAPEGAAGSLTSGGTESCMLAVKTARNHWRSYHPDDDRRPVVLMPVTGHSAFVRGAPTSTSNCARCPSTRTPSRCARKTLAEALAEAGDRACLVVVSAPSYAHGVLDPIAECAALAVAAEVPLHVDACIGGWILPFCEINGEDIAPWDFRVPGVGACRSTCTSTAMRPRVPRCCSSLPPSTGCTLLRLLRLARLPGGQHHHAEHQVGRPMAAAWAVARRIGADGYARLVADARAATAAIVAAVEGIDGLKVVVRRPARSSPSAPMVPRASTRSCSPTA